MKDWIMDQNGIPVEVTLSKKEAMDRIYYDLLNGLYDYEPQLADCIPTTLVRLPDEDLRILIEEKHIVVQQLTSNSVRVEGGKYQRKLTKHLLDVLRTGDIDENMFLDIVCKEITYVEFESELCEKAESESEIVYTIAHEFAHAFLGHGRMEVESGYDPIKMMNEPHPCEIEADVLVKKWGFDKEMRESGASYLYHWDEEEKGL